jgi:hypothetical protein
MSSRKALMGLELHGLQLVLQICQDVHFLRGDWLILESQFLGNLNIFYFFLYFGDCIFNWF